MKILSYGELLWDCYGDNKYIGGAPFNFAAHCSALGADSKLLTAVGEDVLGKEAEKILHLRKIGTEFLQKNSLYPTGSVNVTFKNSVPVYDIKENVAYDYISADEELINKIKAMEFDCFYYGTVSQRSEVSAKSLDIILKSQPTPFIFSDINIRPGATKYEAIKKCLEYSTVIKISQEESHYLWEYGFIEECGSYNQTAVKLSEKYKNLEKIVITLDSDGAYGYNPKSKEEFIESAYKADFVSAVGAGDSFSACFIVSQLQGFSFSESLKRAARLAALVVSSPEAVPDYDIKKLF